MKSKLQRVEKLAEKKIMKEISIRWQNNRFRIIIDDVKPSITCGGV